MSEHSITAAEFVDKYVEGQLKEADIIDVRESYEWEMYHLEKARLVPMNTIPDHVQQLSRQSPIYLLCAHGVRSWHVMNYLMQNGFDNVINVEGGMAEIYSLMNFRKHEG